MHSLKFNILLFFTLIAIVAKPFEGFGVHAQLKRSNSPTILVKAFTKRKQEFVEDSGYDMFAVQQRLHNPNIPSLLLFSFFLTGLFSTILFFERVLTNQALNTIRLNMSPQPHRYLITCKFII